jgi:hypothetical protein
MAKTAYKILWEMGLSSDDAESALKQLRELLPEGQPEHILPENIHYRKGFNDCLAKVKEVLK